MRSKFSLQSSMSTSRLRLFRGLSPFCDVCLSRIGDVDLSRASRFLCRGFRFSEPKPLSLDPRGLKSLSFDPRMPNPPRPRPRPSSRLATNLPLGENLRPRGERDETRPPRPPGLRSPLGGLPSLRSGGRLPRPTRGLCPTRGLSKRGPSRRMPRPCGSGSFRTLIRARRSTPRLNLKSFCLLTERLFPPISPPSMCWRASSASASASYSITKASSRSSGSSRLGLTEGARMTSL
mmetsp:Transcript_24960/g.98595  ORF Transcript_24960/g.98595 Transcript_24960/m.98595 type:complete len:235 (+) Transcript_24960:3033-3737(+)